MSFIDRNILLGLGCRMSGGGALLNTVSACYCSRLLSTFYFRAVAAKLDTFTANALKFSVEWSLV